MSNKIKFKESELVSFIEDLVNEEKLKTRKPILSESKERRIGIWSDRFVRKNQGKSPEVVFENFSIGIHKLNRNGITPDDVSNYLRKNERVISEQATMGLTNKSEGIMGTVWETVREGLYRWILNFMGVKDGVLKDILATVLGNIAFTDLPKLMNCEFLTPRLTMGILEYIQRKTASMVTGMEMGAASEMIIGNSFTNLTNNAQFVEDIERNVRDYLCGALGKKKDQVQDGLKDVEEKKQQEYKGQDLSGGGEVPPETSGQPSSGAMGGIGDIAQKYFKQFMQNMGR